MYEDRGLGLVITDRNTAAVIPAIRDLRPSVAIVVDENKMLGPATTVARIVVWRRTDVDGKNDDHAYTKHDPIRFVRALHETSPDGVALYLGNEPGGSQLVAQVKWAIAALDECDRLGRTGVVCNFEVGVPEPSDWVTSLKPLLERLRGSRHYLGLHEYFPALNSGVDGWHVGRWEFIPPGLRPRIMITELGYAKDLDAHAGWQKAGFDAKVYANVLDQFRAYYAIRDIPAAGFCLGEWHGFNIWTVLPHLQQPKRVLLQPGATPTNVRSKPSLKGSVVGQLRGPTSGLLLGPAPTPSPDGGLPWLAISTSGISGYVRTDAIKIADTPINVLTLPVPWHSQTSSTATLANDCGPTAARMVVGWWLRQRLGMDVPGIKVDDLSREAGLRGTALGTVDQVVTALRAFGVEAKRQTITAGDLRANVGFGKPSIILVNAGVLGTSGTYQGPHFVVVAGRATGLLWVLDPLGQPTGSWVSDDIVAAAMRRANEQGNPSNVGIVPLATGTI